MGCNLLSRRCSSNPYSALNSNPDPNRFTIYKWKVIGDYLIVLVNYPDAKNFEGNKILMYRGFKDPNELLAECDHRLDPHFSNNAFCPIARFPPTEEGAELAGILAVSLTNNLVDLSTVFPL